ncbi:hypothetical protein [Roseomonas indoligenes]|uniref:Uncharacterized protein n=1 Tax=Roseomonas indoligenes TaxID=2820811 RepID=A0A940MWJ8_9PROT|nr:hypothetical protein [Pararoseomonas indoligenes]MBP0492129.1 hypothetical protein [Pararoseomonas indoligenes]
MPDSLPPVSYPHLYTPPPCSTWPADHLHAVGQAYRDAAGRGLDTVECLNLARAAYRAAGGAGGDETITGMIASLSVERGEWLWGPMDEWWARNVEARVNGVDLG